MKTAANVRISSNTTQNGENGMTDPRTPTNDPVAAVRQRMLTRLQALARKSSDYTVGVAAGVWLDDLDEYEEAIRQQARAAFAAQVAAAERDFREYRYRVGKTIHDLGGYKGLADNLGPLGDSVESNLVLAASPEPAKVNAAPEGTASSPVSPHGRRMPASYTVWTVEDELLQLDDLREVLADARRLAYPFSLSPVQRDRIIARIDTLLNAARPDGAEADAS